jgi:hypothetical protein
LGDLHAIGGETDAVSSNRRLSQYLITRPGIGCLSRTLQTPKSGRFLALNMLGSHLFFLGIGQSHEHVTPRCPEIQLVD